MTQARGSAAGAVRGDRVEQPIRAAELVAALSIATDLGTGQPPEHAVRSAVLAVRLGELAGASADELADTYYVALLHASGCTSNGHEAGQLFGDDIAHRAAFYLIDPTKPDEVLEFYRAFVGLAAGSGSAFDPRVAQAFATVAVDELVRDTAPARMTAQAA